MERKIIIGLIASTEYIKQANRFIEPDLFDSDTARILSIWALDYFRETKQAPGKQIEDIYFEQIKKSKIDEDLADEIENDILPDLNEQFIAEGVNVDYLLKKSKEYFYEKKLKVLSEKIEEATEIGDIEAAEQAIEEHKRLEAEDDSINLSDESVLDKIENAFNSEYQNVITYPGELGKLWNDEMVHGGFVSFMAPEKRGKTWMLVDAAYRAARQGKKVAFFQAGDMTEPQFLKRFSIYLAKRSDKERYIGKHLVPCKDCILNQRDECTKEERECDFGWARELDYDENYLRNDITRKELEEAYKDFEDYRPCSNCKAYNENAWGVPWLKEAYVKQALTAAQAKMKYNQMVINRKLPFRLSTHPNGSLSVSKIEAILDTWEIQETFTPDLIVIDYADLLAQSGEFRHAQNQIWKDLRGISQKLNCLVLTATQADADSYGKKSLGMKNFNEDKRKLGHVTALYGLNQDPAGREKEIGLLRINEIVVRESEFNINNQVTILQRLQIGNPILNSYR